MFHANRLRPASFGTIGSRAFQLLAAPLLGRERLFLLLLFRLRRLTLEGTDLLALSVGERQRDLSLGLVAEPVRDEHAIRRVLAGVDVDLSLLPSRLLDLPVRHHRRAGHAVVLAE